jgi:TonB family protein
MGTLKLAKISSMLLLILTATGFGQLHNTATPPRDSSSRFINMRLAEDQIGTLKTAAKLSTRISFREPVKEIVCGDLYDPTSGTGSFVVQRIENDVFVKPVATKGESNLFVKAGERGEHTYNFALVIVSLEQAHTVVKVTFGIESPSTSPVRAITPKQGSAVPATLSITSADFMMDNANSLAPSWLRYGPVFKDPPPPSTIPVRVAVGPRSPTKRVSPEYPDYAKRMNMIGDVVLEVTADIKGGVKSVKVISGPLVFQNSAILAAQQWRFTPGTGNELPVQNTFLITFRYRGASETTDALLGNSDRR